MASTSQNEEQGSSSSAGVSPIEAVKLITWGTNLKEDVFARWGQGQCFFLIHCFRFFEQFRPYFFSYMNIEIIFGTILARGNATAKPSRL